MRAAHQVVDDEPKIFRDPFAVEISESASGRRIEDVGAELMTPACKLLRSAMVLRSRYAEDELAKAVGWGVRQYVLLGAGLDTYALRQPAQANYLRIFEVDTPGTQHWKASLLERREAGLPRNVTYVGADLEKDDLALSLRRAGFRADAPAFFSWLGVTQYLHEAAVEATLRQIAALPAGSAVAFSFNPPEETLDGADRAEAQAAAARSLAAGEPWLTRPMVQDLQRCLARFGFRRGRHLAPAEAQEVYFGERSDGLRAPRFEQLIYAFV